MSTLHEQNPSGATPKATGQNPPSGSQPASQRGAPQKPATNTITEKTPLQQNPEKDAPRTPISAAKDTGKGSKQQQQPSSGEKC